MSLKLDSYFCDKYKYNFTQAKSFYLYGIKDSETHEVNTFSFLNVRRFSFFYFILLRLPSGRNISVLWIACQNLSWFLANVCPQQMQNLRFTGITKTS